MYSLERFSLRDIPFGITPVKELRLWADRKEFKTEVENVIKSALISAPSRIVACFYGDWGMGKTHAATYFSHEETLKELAAELKLKKEPISIDLILPPRDVFDSLYLDIVDRIGIRRIRNAVDVIEKELGPLSGKTIERLSRIMQDERLARVIVKRSEASERYLLLSARQLDLRSLKVTRAIETTSDKLKVLRGILNLLTSTIHSRVIIWIDDAERIELLSGRDLFELQVFLRDLLDYVPQNLNILMNFTLTPGRKMEDIIQFLGEAIRYRLYKTIEVKELTRDEFFDYVKDLLEFYRTAEEVSDPFFPFKKDTLEFIFKKIKEREFSYTPRTINTFLSRIMEEALRDENISVIEKDFVEEKAEKIFAL